MTPPTRPPAGPSPGRQVRAGVGNPAPTPVPELLEETDNPAPAGRGIGVRGWLRWAWRQLTSMRNALIMLLLLALGAVPGSFLPQRPQDPAGVAQYLADHPGPGPWMDRLGLFDVFGSAWYTAIYVLLFISLTGCIVPRLVRMVRHWHAPPPQVPRRLGRYAGYHAVEADAAPTVALDKAAAALGRTYRRHRTVRTGLTGEIAELSAQSGRLREVGNLVFHMALLGVLISLGVGKLYEYSGQVVLVEGDTFTNTRLDFDTFAPGRAFSTAMLDPYRLRLERLDATFTPTGRAQDFTAHVELWPAGQDAATTTSIKVNHPLGVAGQSVYLMSNGYAPRLTVRGEGGQVEFSGAVPFLPQDSTYTSAGVVKVPDVPAGSDQLGLRGTFIPTAASNTAEVSSHPDLLAPQLVLEVWAGDLGLDSGPVQNAFRLDTSAMWRVTQDGEPLTVRLTPGQRVTLPDGMGSVELAAHVPRYAGLEMRHDPSSTPVLIFVSVGIAGLIAMLFVPRRRIWARATQITPGDGGQPGTTGRSLVEVAGLGRAADTGLVPQVRALTSAWMPLDAPPGGEP